MDKLQIAAAAYPISRNDMARLVKATAAATKMFSVDILGPVRMFPFCRARWAVWQVLRERGYSYPRIGAHFNRDHSTIIHGVKQAAKLYETSPEFADLVDMLRGVQ